MAMMAGGQKGKRSQARKATFQSKDLDRFRRPAYVLVAMTKCKKMKRTPGGYGTGRDKLIIGDN